MKRYAITGQLIPLSENGVPQVGLTDVVNIPRKPYDVYLADDVQELQSRLEAQSKLLDDLARRHEGWEQGCGPCVCEHHEAWRKSRVVERREIK